MSILPGATLGMLGGGQLGRMFTIAARTMGYNVVVLDPNTRSPAGELATTHICADYSDPAALAQIAKNCDVITTEFENVPASTLASLAETKPVRPGTKAISIAQDRIQEKKFLKDNGFYTAPFAVINALDDLKNSISTIGTPAILKVSRLGYDGKGQFAINTESDIEKAWQALEGEACVLEQRVPLDIEVSVVLARGTEGEVSSYPVSENIHAGGILDVSIVPARIDQAIKNKIINMAKDIAIALDYVGLMAVEFFISDGKILVNEIAPRPHNSGHYTLDACITNQFEQQVRAVCGLALGDTRLLTPVVMINMLGDIWHNGNAPQWQKLLKHPNVKLHLYGKPEARPGRKMGHFNVLSENINDALKLAEELKQQLSKV